jgi:integrase
MSDAPRTRRGNLESWISSEPNQRGYFEAKVWMGYKGDGTPDRRHVQRKTLKAVKAQVKKLEGMRDKGQVGQPGKVPTVQEMLERHLNVVLPQRGRAPRTIADYWSKCRNDIFPLWGGQRADRLRPEHIEDGLAALLDKGRSAAHVRKVLAILSSAYELQAKRAAAYGLAGGTTLTNPCKFVEPPELGETTRKSLTLKQARAVLAEAQKRGQFARWAVGLSLGLRQGEALGLRWRFLDVDVPDGEAGEMRVWAQLQRLSWEHGCDDPHACGADHHRRPCPVPCPKAARKQGRKHVCPQDGGNTARSASGTKGKLCPPDCTAHAQYCPRRKLPRGSVRLAAAGALVIRESVKEKKRKTIPVPPEVCAALRDHRNAQLEQKMLADTEWNANDLVFARWNGAPVDPRRDWTEWGAILEAAGIPHSGVHTGRHTAVTIAIDEGIAITAVQQLAGHSNVKTTEGYDHSSSPGARIAARAVSRALFGKEDG